MYPIYGLYLYTLKFVAPDKTKYVVEVVAKTHDEAIQHMTEIILSYYPDLTKLGVWTLRIIGSIAQAQKINAIALLRSLTGLGLAHSKDLVEACMEIDYDWKPI
jgi:ribosomal protein L7/L12